jgi:hypothetical protein
MEPLFDDPNSSRTSGDSPAIAMAPSSGRSSHELARAPIRFCGVIACATPASKSVVSPGARPPDVRACRDAAGAGMRSAAIAIRGLVLRASRCWRARHADIGSTSPAWTVTAPTSPPSPASSATGSVPHRRGNDDRPVQSHHRGERRARPGYSPVVTSDFRLTQLVRDDRHRPGEPVMVTAVSVGIEGPARTTRIRSRAPAASAARTCA